MGEPRPWHRSRQNVRLRGGMGFYSAGEMQKRVARRGRLQFMATTGSEGEMNVTAALPLVMNGGGEVLVTTVRL